MDVPIIVLYKTLMAEATDTTRFIESFHHLPDPRWNGAILAIRRAGLIVAGNNYAVKRSGLQGHDLIYCVSGAGVVGIGESRHEIVAGQLVWLAGNVPHSHAADLRNPWTVMWLRLDGPQVEACRARLLGNDGAIVTITHGAALVAWFQRLFACMRQRAPDTDLALNALAAELLMLLDAELRGGPDLRLPAPIARLTQALNAQPQLPWREAEMIAIAHVSGAHLRRLFKQHLQSTPRGWLRRERIMLAQELLLNSQTKIASVAEACGFADIYHFSRDFKRSVGQSPREWRQSEIGYGESQGPIPSLANKALA